MLRENITELDTAIRLAIEGRYDAEADGASTKTMENAYRKIDEMLDLLEKHWPIIRETLEYGQ